MSNTNKSAAPITTLLLAAVVALEVTGMQALPHTDGRTLTATSVDGDAGYMLVETPGSPPAAVVAQAGY
ncbi:MAG TPA: hypothetical protein VIN75_20610 [Burkholderiaceae bacterium]